MSAAAVGRKHFREGATELEIENGAVTLELARTREALQTAIAERNWATAELAKSEEEFQSFLESASMGIASIDPIRSNSFGDERTELFATALARVALARSRAGRALDVSAGKVFEAQEEERKRIARELHDGPNQELAMLALEAGLLVRQAPAGATALIESLDRLRQRAEGLSNDLRHIAHQLHPAGVEYLGLVAALQNHCEEFSQQGGVRVCFSVLGDIAPPSDMAICLYRIVQEALRNVAKHSGARQAWVHITTEPDGIQLSVVDNGSGFDFDEGRMSSGLGLISIRERVQSVSGSLSITSAPGEGTRIEVHVPLI